MRIGYARVSTDEQSLDLQLDALKRAGCKRVFVDRASAVMGDRSGLADAVSHLRSGDVLVVCLEAGPTGAEGEEARGVRGGVAGARGRLGSLTDGIDTTNPAGRFCFHIMASLAQMERELMADAPGPDWTRRGGEDASGGANGG